ncbi:MAG TPA: HipA domain-containing protein [Longimicrobiales bacterium]|nr:HipA domain-containing protein [Longimicrobiales bacterium]
MLAIWKAPRETGGLFEHAERDSAEVFGAFNNPLPDGYRHFLARSPATEDAPDIGAVEAANALMARSAGEEVPGTTLFETRDGGRYFAAERFDREGALGLHMHTLSGLLHASHRLPSME